MSKLRPLVMVWRIVGGKLKPIGKPLWREALSRWPDGEVTVEIRPKPQTRTARANAYMWAAVYPEIAKEMGVSDEDLHELMKIRHLSKTVVDFESGEEVKIPGSTAKLSGEEFTAYLDAVMLDGATFFGIVFRPPTSAEEYRDTRAVA